MSDPKVFDCLNPYDVSYKFESAMIEKSQKSHTKAFILAIAAGAFIGLGFIYCGLANVKGAGNIVGGIFFSLGLILVILFGVDLFTTTTLTGVAVAGKHTSWQRALANWCVVYTGNFVGAHLLIAIVFLSGHLFDGNGAMAQWYLNTAAHKLGHTTGEAIGLGILCNIMVCLAFFLSLTGRSSFDKIAACLMPVGLFISGGFEHSIANMYMIPSAIYIMHFAPESFLAHLQNAEHLKELFTWGNFITLNLIPVTIGNIIGGFLLGFFQWVVYLRPGVKRH